MKTKITFEFDDEVDTKYDQNAHINGPKLAECIYDMQTRVFSEWEKCEVFVVEKV